jgi:hypothetical protein
MVPAAEIARFEVTEIELTREETEHPRTVYGIRAKCPKGDRDILPSHASSTRNRSEILCELLNAFILHQGSTNQALARVGEVRRFEGRLIVVLIAVILGFGVGLVWFVWSVRHPHH